jgi:hypothetical protein
MKHSHAFQTTVSGVALALTALAVGGNASAQTTTDWSYEVGLRTTFMATEMALSELGGGFADLPAGGKALPHSSSLFVLWSLGAHTRVGIETLVGNSYPGSDADILFQGTGVTVEYQTTGTWFAAASLQAGGMIASATQSPDDNALSSGVHYKQSGYFLAPQIGFGRRLRRFDIRLVGKPVWHFGGNNIDAFDGFYAGISVARVSR